VDAADLGIRDGDLASTLIPTRLGSAAADQRQSLLVLSELVPLRPVLVRAENSDLDWFAPDGVPSGWVVFSTEPIMQRFMDPQHQVILQLRKSQSC
jgi:hypothetical protein